jgi:uncharacterized UBP type Zn finger protein
MENYKENLARLISMGFPQDQSEKALQFAGNNGFPTALEW